MLHLNSMGNFGHITAAKIEIFGYLSTLRTKTTKIYINTTHIMSKRNILYIKRQENQAEKL